MPSDESDLEYTLRTRFEGIDDGERYARVLRDVAEAETLASRAVRASIRTQSERAASARAATQATRDSLRFPTGTNQRLTEARADLKLAQSAGVSGDVQADLETRFQRLIRQVEREQSPDLGPEGPRGRLETARRRLNRARAAGVGGDRLADLEDRVKMAQGQVDRLNPTNADRIAQAITTTRFGGGLAPLVGRTAQALGVENPTAALSKTLSDRFPALGGPAGTGIIRAIGPIAAGATLIFKAAQEAGKALRQMAQDAVDNGQAMADGARRVGATRDVSGGTLSESARLNALGISGSDARALVDRISSDPFARGAAGKMGVSTVPGPYGTLDTAGVALKVVDGLRRITSAEERLRQARILGVEGMLHLTRISETSYQAITRDADLQASVFNERRQRSGAEFDVSRQRYDDAKTRFKAIVEEPFTEAVTDFFNTASDLINAGTKKFDNDQNRKDNRFLRDAGLLGLDFATSGKSLPFTTLARAAFARGDKARDGAFPVSTHVQALYDNTEALNRLNRNVGEGARSRNAIPGALADGRNLAIAISTGQLRQGIL